MHKIYFLRKHKPILQTIRQNTLCIISGLHNLRTRQPSSMARAKAKLPCPGSGTCHQKGGNIHDNARDPLESRMFPNFPSHPATCSNLQYHW